MERRIIESLDSRILHRYIECGGRFYCPYCGNELKDEEDINISEREIEHYFSCDCDDAKKEMKIMRQIEELKLKLPAVKYETRPQVVKKRGY